MEVPEKARLSRSDHIATETRNAGNPLTVPLWPLPEFTENGPQVVAFELNLRKKTVVPLSLSKATTTRHKAQSITLIGAAAKGRRRMLSGKHSEG